MSPILHNCADSPRLTMPLFGLTGSVNIHSCVIHLNTISAGNLVLHLIGSMIRFALYHLVAAAHTIIVFFLFCVRFEVACNFLLPIRSPLAAFPLESQLYQHSLHSRITNHEVNSFLHRSNPLHLGLMFCPPNPNRIRSREYPNRRQGTPLALPHISRQILTQTQVQICTEPNLKGNCYSPQSKFGTCVKIDPQFVSPSLHLPNPLPSKTQSNLTSHANRPTKSPPSPQIKEISVTFTSKTPPHLNIFKN